VYIRSLSPALEAQEAFQRSVSSLRDRRSGAHGRTASAAREEGLFEPLFYDLNRIDEEKLIGAVQTVAALVFFKYIKRAVTEVKSEEEATGIDRIEDLEALDAALDEIIDADEKRQVMEKLGM
jgi:hypothetical protein